MTQKSSDQLLESLSALVDNEASELEVRRILKNVERNPEVRERWRRYNMIGSVLRKENNLNLGGTVDLAAGVSQAILLDQAFSSDGVGKEREQEPTQSGASGSTANRSGLFDFIAKSAVAASFAGALVVGFNMFGSGLPGEFDDATGGQLANVTAQQSTTEQNSVSAAPLGFELPRLESRTVGANSGAQPVSSSRVQLLNSAQSDDLTDVATQSLLNELLIHHAAKASSNGSLGIMPFARVSQMQPLEASQ